MEGNEMGRMRNAGNLPQRRKGRKSGKRNTGTGEFRAGCFDYRYCCLKALFINGVFGGREESRGVNGGTGEDLPQRSEGRKSVNGKKNK